VENGEFLLSLEDWDEGGEGEMNKASFRFGKKDAE
jgi:hypothetical protein